MIILEFLLDFFHVPIIDDKAEGQDFKDDFFKYVLWESILNDAFGIPTFLLLKINLIYYQVQIKMRKIHHRYLV